MATTYHLWLKPSGKVYDILAKTIAELSKAYQAPFFEPHVTLLSSLPGTEEEITGRSSQLGTSLRPFDIQLTEPAYGDQYFQCVFLKVQETQAILNAHEQAKKLFAKGTSPYMPHLSLLYGHYSIERKDKIAATLPEILRLSFLVDTVDLIRAGSEDPKDWLPILSVPLSR
ncbi:MAG: 2'-5' RNA ligase family protein [Nitrospirota bacterium]|nr:2'-5' RNA ligase family protein [Nitrospirota bacterium]